MPNRYIVYTDQALGLKNCPEYAIGWVCADTWQEAAAIVRANLKHDNFLMEWDDLAHPDEIEKALRMKEFKEL